MSARNANITAIMITFSENQTSDYIAKNVYDLVSKCARLSLENELLRLGRSNISSTAEQLNASSGSPRHYDEQLSKNIRKMVVSSLDLRLTASYRLGRMIILAVRKPSVSNTLLLPVKMVRLALEIWIQRKVPHN